MTNMHTIVEPKKFGNVSIGDMIELKGRHYVVCNVKNCYYYKLQNRTFKYPDDVFIHETVIAETLKSATLEKKLNIAQDIKLYRTEVALSLDNKILDIFKVIPLGEHSLFYYPLLGKIFTESIYPFHRPIEFFLDKTTSILDYSNILSQDEYQKLCAHLVLNDVRQMAQFGNML